MRLHYPKLSICLLAGTILTALSHASYAEIGSRIDPDIPSYIPRDSLSGGLTISVPEVMKPLVQAWADDLIRQYSELQIVVISERSHTSLTGLLAHRSEMTAMSRRMTTTELGNCLLELGYKPIAVPIAHHTSAIFVRNGDPSAGTRFSPRVQTLESTSGIRHGSKEQPGIRLGLTGYKIPLVEPLRINATVSDGYATSVTRSQVDSSPTFRRSVYLYIAKPLRANATQASAELIRYALSRQGQQLALDLGYVPLSFEEVRRVTSWWSTSRW